MDMNEGENLGIPQSPNFSSPNISSADDSLKQDLSSEPTQQAITSSDVAAMSGTDAGAVAAAAASMTEDDAPVAVSSGAITGSTQKGAQPAGAHFNFGARRYHGSDNTRQAIINDYVQLEYPEVKPRKSKKWLFVVIVIILLAGIGVGVYFLIPKGGNGTISQKTKDLFYTFANYALYGEDKKEPLEGEYEYGSRYYYGTLMSDSDRESYLKTAKEKYDAFKKSYESDKVENEELTKKIQDYESDLDLYYYMNKYPVVLASVLFDYYAKNGKKATEDSISSYIAGYNESSFELTRAFGSDYKSMTLEALIKYEALVSRGCIILGSSTISHSCQTSSDAAYSGDAKRLSEYYEYVAKKIGATMTQSKKVFRGIWQINKVMYTKNEKK